MRQWKTIFAVLALAGVAWAQQTGGGQAGSGGAISGLTKGQRITATAANTISSVGPVYDTSQLTGSTIDARVAACLALLPSTGGTCDSTAETTGLTTAATITISGNGVTWILPALTVTEGVGFYVNVTGNNDMVTCSALWSCLLNGQNNGTPGVITVSGTGDNVVGVHMQGALLYNGNANEATLGGSNNVYELNWMQYAGGYGLVITNCTGCIITRNLVDQALKAAIYVNTSSGNSDGNKVTYNEIRDSNTIDTGDGQLGIASSVGFGGTRRTLVEGNYVHNLSSVASGNGTAGRTSCNGDTTGAIALAITSVSTNGTTGTVVTPANPFLQCSSGCSLTGATASVVVLSGITGGNSSLNGTALTVASSSTTGFTFATALNNGNTGGTVTFVVAGHGTAASGCSESIQITDNPIDTLVTQNEVANSWREGMVIAGSGNRMIANHCESCGILGVGVGAFMWSNTTTPQSTIGDGEISDNVATNRTASLTTGYCVSINDASASSAFTLENFLVANNQCYSDTTLTGPPAISKGLRFINNSANTWTLNNVTFSNNTLNRGVTTPLSLTYTNTTGVVVMDNNRVNSAQDTAPVAGHFVSFDANLQPSADVGNNMTFSGATLSLGSVGGTAGAITFLGTTSGSVGWGCSPATTCGNINTTAAVQIGKLAQVNSIATAGSTGVAAVRASPAAITTGSGTSIGSTSICGSAVCTAGLYFVHVYLEITTACTTTGTYSVSLIYTDDQGSKTAVVPLQGIGAVFVSGTTSTGVTDSVDLSSTGHFGQATVPVYTTGSTSINYSTTAVACGTGGPMVGKLYLSVESAN